MSERYESQAKEGAMENSDTGLAGLKVECNSAIIPEL